VRCASLRVPPLAFEAKGGTHDEVNPTFQILSAKRTGSSAYAPKLRCSKAFRQFPMTCFPASKSTSALAFTEDGRRNPYTTRMLASISN